MIGYIKLLNQEVFESLGYSFDGSYWVKQPFPFKFQLNADQTYSVIIDGVPINQLPAPVKTNSDVIQLMVSFTSTIVSGAYKVATNEQMQGNSVFKFINKAILEAYKTPTNFIQIKLIQNNGSVTLIPLNEETYTLISGIQCKFRFTSGDFIEEILIDPNCMSYDYLCMQFPDHVSSNWKLEVYKNETELIPFCGIGLPKTNSNEVTE